MMTILPYIYMGAGVFFALYFIILWIYCRRIPAFGWFWVLMSGVFITAGWQAEGELLLLISWIELAAALCFAAGALILRKEGNKKAGPGADYVIVLGARVNGSVPSKALRNRIMTAYRYLKENPDTKAVLTGGKGPGENMTEAACMMGELTRLGIDRKRLILEQKSRTTRENIEFARNLMDCSKGDKEHFFVIVTNDFHALRGKRIGKSMGFERVESLGAPSAKVMKLHYYTRETLSWIKLGISGKRDVTKLKNRGQIR